MKFDIFSELDAARIEEIKAASKYVELPRGSILFYEGDVCESVLYLTQGRIKILVGGTDETPAQIPLYDFCEGEQCIVNIASALSSSPAIATAQALTDIRGWLIPVRVIQRLIAESPAYQKTVFRLFTLRYSSLTTLIEEIKFKRLDSRILEYLRSFGTDEIAVKNSDIAEHLGTSRNVVNRVLQDLKDKNLIKLGRGKIRLVK